jgi:hypothetical protein
MIYEIQNNRMARPTGKHAWRSERWVVATLLLFLIAPMLGGCATYTALTWGPLPDLSDITVGLSRTEVDERMGAASDHDNNVYHYEYNSEEGSGAGLGSFLVFMDVITLGTAYGEAMPAAHRAQLKHAHIVYGPDGLVAGLSRDWADETFRDWLHGEDHEGSLSILCLAARRGDAGAQYVQAMRYRYGLWITERNPIEALAWMKFAAFSGHPRAARRSEQWASQLDPAAEQMFQTGGMHSCGDPADDIRDLERLPSMY